MVKTDQLYLVGSFRLGLPTLPNLPCRTGFSFAWSVAPNFNNLKSATQRWTAITSLWSPNFRPIPVLVRAVGILLPTGAQIGFIEPCSRLLGRMPYVERGRAEVHFAAKGVSIVSFAGRTCAQVQRLLSHKVYRPQFIISSIYINFRLTTMSLFLLLA